MQYGDRKDKRAFGNLEKYLTIFFDNQKGYPLYMEEHYETLKSH
jgi:hypothetical protein